MWCRNQGRNKCGRFIHKWNLHMWGEAGRGRRKEKWGQRGGKPSWKGHFQAEKGFGGGKGKREGCGHVCKWYLHNGRKTRVNWNNWRDQRWRWEQSWCKSTRFICEWYLHFRGKASSRWCGFKRERTGRGKSSRFIHKWHLYRRRKAGAMWRCRRIWR